MRTLISGAAWPVDYHGEVVRLLEVATDVGTHYWGSKQVTYDGHTYLAWLAMDESIHYYRSLQVDSGSVKLQNADAQMEALIFAERFEGAAARLSDYFVDLDDAGILFQGILTERQADASTISWRLIPSWDPAQIEAPARNYTRVCPWRFKDAECGYAGGLTTCDKTFAACTTRARTHAFAGFLQVTADLQKVYLQIPQITQTGARRVTGRRNL